MKISEIRGERTLDLIADIAGPIASIAADEEAMALFAPGEVPEGETRRQHFAKRVGVAAPALIRGHRDDIIAILSALEGVSPEEYAKSLSLPKLLGDLVSVMTDEDLLAFLPQVETDLGSSTGASAPTEVPSAATLSVVS